MVDEISRLRSKPLLEGKMSVNAWFRQVACCAARAFHWFLRERTSCIFSAMKSALRWTGLYLLNLLTATLGVLGATGILLNVVLKPVEPLIGHSQLFSLAKGPYYPLPLVLAVVVGYLGYIRFKGNHRFWVWVLPALYLAIKIILWKPKSVLGGSSWEAAIAHFFAGEPPYYPEQDVTVPFYTSVAYSVGALLQRSGLFYWQHSGETASDASNQQE